MSDNLEERCPHCGSDQVDIEKEGRHDEYMRAIRWACGTWQWLNRQRGPHRTAQCNRRQAKIEAIDLCIEMLCRPGWVLCLEEELDDFRESIRSLGKGEKT